MEGFEGINSKDIIQMAIQLELDAEDFYKNASLKLHDKKEISGMLRVLSKEEQGHATKLNETLEIILASYNKPVDDKIIVGNNNKVEEEDIKANLEDIKPKIASFTDKLNEMKEDRAKLFLDTVVNPMDVIKFALTREGYTIAFYRELKKIFPKKFHFVFEKILLEEKGHVEKLLSAQSHLDKIFKK